MLTQTFERSHCLRIIIPHHNIVINKQSHIKIKTYKELSQILNYMYLKKLN